MTDNPLDARARDDIGHGCFAVDPDGEIVALHESIRDALIARGDLRCVDGVWYIRDIDVADQLPWLTCCDFCAGRPVVWTVRCAPFTQGDWQTAGDFAACDSCGRLVQLGDRPGLLNRGLAGLKAELNSEFVDADAVRVMQDAFWQHYLGQVEPVPARPFGH